ncbi:putative quinol monooxygenase [Sphingobium sp. TCM1]|uniref:putative quinol monooxygenase n=1 Tax=Sphingobium sp. TCM1 TaxID=453246 RepID=UPI0007F3DB1A|nr:putative quinol monooxygenase [Sphingobium sp. TCM1]OAN56261.1 hypothetical protein A7Q26_02340 [Sphingobium sp. TCM1]
MILFDVSLEALPGREEEMASLLRRTMVATQVEDGCIQYRFTRDLDAVNRFHLIELWRNEAALMAHASGPTFRAFLAALPPLGRLLQSTPRQGDLAPYLFVRPNA